MMYFSEIVAVLIVTAASSRWFVCLWSENWTMQAEYILFWCHWITSLFCHLLTVVWPDTIFVTVRARQWRVCFDDFFNFNRWEYCTGTYCTVISALALHGMPARTSDEKGVCLSVCLSVC